MSLLPQSAGYATILVGGAFFAALMNTITWVQKRYTNFDPGKIEEFSSASRSVKTGMMSVGITPAWVGGAVFLQTGTLTYLYGISMPWWFGMGGFVEIAAFAFVSSKIKANASGASTYVPSQLYLQVAKVRFGTLGHLAYMFTALVANFVVGSEILIGGAGVITGMTGISEYAAIWLLLLVVVAYGAADYLHCCILFSCLLVLVPATYTRGDVIGSPSKLYDLLLDASKSSPAVSNTHESYLSFRSDGDMYITDYAVTAATSFLGLSSCDRSYWQRSIATRPAGTSKSFIFAGCFFFSVAFGIGSSMGLAARALSTNPAFPAYPQWLSAAQIGAGLAGPFASVTILGKAGPAMYTIIAFMATTSALSAQLVAVSTIFSYDIYRGYTNKSATDVQMMKVNHAVVILWAVFLAGIDTAFAYIGLDLNFLFYLMAVCTSGAVFPIGLLMCWSKLNKAGAVLGVFGGLAIGMLGWLVTAVTTLGTISITTLTDSKVILAGSLSALSSGAIVSILLSLINPASFDFERTRAIGREQAAAVSTESIKSSERIPEHGLAELKESLFEPALCSVEGGGRTIDTGA